MTTTSASEPACPECGTNAGSSVGVGPIGEAGPLSGSLFHHHVDTERIELGYLRGHDRHASFAPGGFIGYVQDSHRDDILPRTVGA